MASLPCSQLQLNYYLRTPWNTCDIPKILPVLVLSTVQLIDESSLAIGTNSLSHFLIPSCGCRFKVSFSLCVLYLYTYKEYFPIKLIIIIDYIIYQSRKPFGLRKT